MHDSVLRLGIATVSATLALAACAGASKAPDAAAGCRAQVIIGLAPGVSRTDSLVAELAAEATVQLRYLRASGGDLFVFELRARDGDARCAAPLQRLRSDRRVRLAELDVTRTRHG